MHLFFENLVPNLILHWTGKFKGLDQGTGNYELSGVIWDAIGMETAASVRTIPSAFVGTLPDIAQDAHLYKAEAYTFWIQFIAPIVLEGRLPRQYYQHVLLLREIIITCLEFSVTSDDIDRLDTMVKTWVTQYEQYYYQYDASRVPVCPLTIHAILHVPFYLRQTGPLWASWAFVMERFCGHLLPAVKNRVRPYEHLDNFVQRRAQMQALSHVRKIPALARSSIAKRRIEDGVELSSREVTYPDFPALILGVPVKKRVEMTRTLMNQLTKYFGVVYGQRDSQYLRSHIDGESVVHYGRFRMAGDGDKIRTASLIAGDPSARNNSFYALLPDAKRRFETALTFHTGKLSTVSSTTFISSSIQRMTARDATLEESPVVRYERMLTPHMVHLDTIEAVVGRVRRGNIWFIIDRSRNGIRTQFVADDEDELD